MLEFLKKSRNHAALPDGIVRIHFRVEGRVQGVGFRYRAKYAAQSLGLTGWVENMDDGSVEMELQGDPDQIYRIFPIIQQSDYVLITDMQTREIPVDSRERGFYVLGY